MMLAGADHARRSDRGFGSAARARTLSWDEKRESRFRWKTRGMNRETLFEYLVQAARYAEEGERRIAKQEILIADLNQKGLDTTEALAVLAIFRDTQMLHLQDVARIAKELERS